MTKVYKHFSSLRAELEVEHEGAGDILKELGRGINNYELPEHVCRTYELTLGKLEELEVDIFQHIHLENNILFSILGIDESNTRRP